TIRDSEVRACLAIFLTAFAVAFDDPAHAQAGEAQGLREIPKDRRVRQRGGRRDARTMINGMEHLIADELNPAFKAEVVEVATRRFRYDAARRIVRRVDEQEGRARVAQAL